MRAPDPELLAAVRDVLAGHVGIENAISGARIASLVGEMLDARPVHLRRVGEAVAEIRKAQPVCGLSSAGYWLPANPEELAWSVAEKRRRALSVLAELRAEKRHLLVMRGQRSLEAA